MTSARRAHAARRRRAARHRLRRARHSSRAFITTAHRGQNIPVQSPAHDAGRRPRRRLGVRRGRTSAPSLGGTPLTIVTLFSDTPRALAVTPDGSHGLRGRLPLRQPHDGRHRGVVPDGGEAAGGVPGPDTNFQGIPQPEVGPHREVQRRALGRRARPQLGRQRAASRCPTRTSSSSTPRANPPRAARGRGGLLHRRRHDPLQHGGQPGEREGLRLATPRRGTSCASRAPASSPGTTRARPPAESRITVLDAAGAVDAAAPQQAHRLRAPAARRSPTPRTSRASRMPHGMAVTQRRRDALRRRVRLEQGRRLRHRASSRTTRSSRAPANQIARERRRPDRPRARRGARPPLRADPLRQRDLGRRHRDDGARSRTSRCTTPSRRASSHGRRFLYDARAHARATATRRARAATSSATSTASPGTSATPTAP